METNSFQPEKQSNLPVGTIVGASYQIKGVLSQNPQTTVYLAEHKILSKDVALKVLSLADDPEAKNRLLRFQKEAKIASGLSHPNIIKTLASGVLENGCPYIVMELADGETLRGLLNKKSKLSLELFKEIFVQVLSGLEYAHEARLLHRDIKPENILLSNTTDGELIAKIADFGIAKVLDEAPGGQSLTSTIDVLGSPAYMSPEQCRKQELDQRSDIYSIACVMYESLTGKPVFDSDSAFDLMYKHLNEEPMPLRKLLPSTPKSLADLIERCLAKKPDERCTSVKELRQDLESLSASAPSFSIPAVVKVLLVLLAFVAIGVIVSQNMPRKVSKINDFGPTEQALAHRVTFEEFEEAMASNRYNEALKLLNQMKSNPMVRDKSHLALCFAYYYRNLHKFSLALQAAKDASDFSQKIVLNDEYHHYRFPYEEAKIAEAACYAALKEFVIADKTLKGLKGKLIKLRDDFAESRLLYSAKLIQSYILRARHEYAEGIWLCQSVLNEEPVTELRIQFLIDLMKIYALQNDRSRLESTRKLVSELIQNAGLDVQAAEKEHYGTLVAEPYLLAEDWASARQILTDPSRLSRTRKELETLSTVHYLLLRIVVDLATDHLTDAENELNLAVGIQEKIADGELSVSYLNSAYVAYKKGDAASAEKFIEKAMSFDQKDCIAARSEIQVAKVLSYLAERLAKDGNKTAAHRCLEQLNSLVQTSNGKILGAPDSSRHLRKSD